MTRPKIGAMFAGYGGLDLAVEEVFGATTAWVSEFDAAPSRILARRFPDAPNHGDVTKIDWAAVEPVDIITGGSPCQDLSHAGKRAGMKAGTRSGLWASMCDAIETIRPRYVVWENVRGALSAEADSAVEPCPICVGDGRGVTLRALGRVLGDLAELGYDACWTGLRAADVGAPHGRFRVFVLAWDATRPAGLEGNTAPSVAADLGHERPGTSRDRRVRPADRGGQPVALLPTPAVNDMGASYDIEKWDAWTARMKSEHGNGNGHGNSLHIEALRMLPTPQAMDTAGAMTDRRSTSGYGPALRDVATLLPTPTATDHRASGASYAGTDTHHQGTTLTDATVRNPEINPDLLPTPSVADVEGGRKHRSGARSGELLLNGLAHAQAFGQYTPAIDRWETVLGRPAPAPTEPTGKGGAHRLSPRFVEWMMGLPDGWVTDTDTTRNEQLKALGNGVVPQQAAAALRHMLNLKEVT